MLRQAATPQRSFAETIMFVCIKYDANAMHMRWRLPENVHERPESQIRADTFREPFACGLSLCAFCTELSDFRRCIQPAENLIRGWWVFVCADVCRCGQMWAVVCDSDDDDDYDVVSG